MARMLVTGITGYVGSRLAPRLQSAGHEVRGFARRLPERELGVPIVTGDAITGAGLDEALEGVEVAYFLIHSMEASADGPFGVREQVAAERFARVASARGVRRIVYLGGLAPPGREVSRHLASRLEVERVLLHAVPGSVALRASIVIGAQSRSFRFLVRLIERLPVLALPAWRVHRTSPIDERDIIEMLARAAVNDAVRGEALDAGGRDVVTYRELIERIRDLMLVGRPVIGLPGLTLTPIASRIASVLAGEDPELIGPLMESLTEDLLPRDNHAAHLLGVRLHGLDAAIEHALREWEAVEPLAAR